MTACDVSCNIHICHRQTNIHIKYNITISTHYGYVTPVIKQVSHITTVIKHFLSIILPTIIMFKSLLVITIATFGIFCKVSNIILTLYIPFLPRSSKMKEDYVLTVLTLL